MSETESNHASPPRATMPMCKTCPYWQIDAIESDAHGDAPLRHGPEYWGATGECRRRAPVATHHERHGGPLFAEKHGHSLVWPRTDEADWCGEHPGMAGFIAARYMAGLPVFGSDVGEGSG